MKTKSPIRRLLALALLASAPITTYASQSDADIKRAIIAESVAKYPGSCPCPYNSARNGSSCGRRSAYSRAGGYSPVCYEKDVTPQMIESHRSSSSGMRKNTNF